MDTWQIIHIPDKPPIPPNQQPTVDVCASVIEPKLANSLVRRLNQIAPLENLRHVKRVQKKALEGGKTQLSVILCLACENESIPQPIQELVHSHQLTTFAAKVCKYAATSKEEWEEQCKLWPTSYHLPTYNINGITGFSDEDSQSIFSFMKYVVELAKSGDGLIVNAAVIVDPSDKQMIASACDQVCCWDNFLNKINNGTGSLKHAEGTCPCDDSDGVKSQGSLVVNGSSNEPKHLYTSVSCLYPWQWAEQQLLNPSSGYCHPLRHAALVAIESSAARDRRLFPSLGPSGDKSYEVDSVPSFCVGSPAKRQKTNFANGGDDNQLDHLTEDTHSLSARPYLCTGYDIFLAWEPCTMCAMALVHQRIRRIFYAFPNPNAGALGSVHRLQGEKSLNHHYAVFRVLLSEEILHKNEPVAEGTLENEKTAIQVMGSL